jgi:hypothetical protein
VKTGGPAFPLHNHGAQTLGLDVTGMTLRDYFAAKVLEAYLPYALDRSAPKTITATAAYAMADAMLKARSE